MKLRNTKYFSQVFNFYFKYKKYGKIFAYCVRMTTLRSKRREFLFTVILENWFGEPAGRNAFQPLIHPEFLQLDGRNLRLKDLFNFQSLQLKNIPNKINWKMGSVKLLKLLEQPKRL